MKITRFEELYAWQRSRELFRMTQRLISQRPLSGNFPLKDQMTRSSLSVMSNIAEGFDRGGNREFIHYLYLSKGSCSEFRSQLYAAVDSGNLGPEDFEAAFALAEETSRIIQGLIHALRKSERKGRKFVPEGETPLNPEP